jgi:signal transduction histidine kinase/CheY-like chemotaxis protein
MDNPHDATPFASIFGQVLNELRADVLNKGVIIIFVLAGLVGMAVTGVSSFDAAHRPLLGVFALLMGWGLVCAYLSWAGRPRLAAWLCVAGSLPLCFALLLTGGFQSVFWMGVPGVLAVWLIRPGAGWLVWLLMSACTTFFAATQPLLIARPIAAEAVALAGVLVFLTHSAYNAFANALAVLNDSAIYIRKQMAAVRDQSAELTAALKSLNQTSFALARANEQLEIAVNYAEQARRSKQEFAAIISHELRTPLNLIIGFSDVILYAPKTYYANSYADSLPAKLLADVTTIHRSAAHLSKLVNDILDLSQLDVNHMAINRERIQPIAIVEATLADIAPLVNARGLSLRAEVEPNLPDVFADHIRIKQVLLNLLNNALRFTERGELTVQVSHDTDALPACVVMRVADTGCGIAPDDLQRVFEPFTQLDAASNRQHSGSGLGLTISKRFIELHGGSMWVVSTPGQGSTFCFSLPIVPPSPLVAVERLAHEVHRREVGMLAVIEPEPVLSRILDRHLNGITIQHAHDLAELAEMARRAPPEMVLINAPELAAAPSPLAHELAHTPVLRCHAPGFLAGAPSQSGNSPAEPAESSPATRMLLNLFKPIEREHLYAAVTKMLAWRAARIPTHLPRPARVLLVEDDEDALRLLGRMLRMMPPDAHPGFTSIVPEDSVDGADALAVLQSHALPDAVLLDIRLGAISGWDVLRTMDAQIRLRDIPVCLISGGALSHLPIATSYISLSKPEGLTLHELTEAIAALTQVALPGIHITTSFSSSSSPSSS